MILPKEKVINLSDDEYEELTRDFNNEIDKYIKNMAQEYAAFYVAMGYKMSAISENKLSVITYSAISSLDGTTNRLCDLEEVKKILENKYRLKVVDDTTTAIEEMDDYA